MCGGTILYRLRKIVHKAVGRGTSKHREIMHTEENPGFFFPYSTSHPNQIPDYF
jgi:hypothetical protein